MNNVQTTPAPSGLWVKVDSGAGATQMSDPVEVSLYQFMSLLNEFDPELAKQVAEAHPRLAQNNAAVAGFGSGNAYGASMPGSGHGPDANQITRLRAQGMASWNPDNALALTQSITDPNMRAVTMGSVAERIAGDDSSRAMQLLDQAQKTAGGYAGPEDGIATGGFPGGSGGGEQQRRDAARVVTAGLRDRRSVAAPGAGQQSGAGLVVHAGFVGADWNQERP